MCAPNWLTSSLLQRMEPSKFGRAMKKLELTTVTLVKIRAGQESLHTVQMIDVRLS